MFSSIFFDLDDTLYHPDAGIMAAMKARIVEYMRGPVGIPEGEVIGRRDSYLAQYGTTLRGLILDYAIDPDDYLAYVHALPIESLVKPNQALAAMLARLPHHKYIFTNSSLDHSRRVLRALGIADHFSGIISIERLGYISKPDESIYPLALELAGGNSAGSTLYLDDQLRNLAPARRLEMSTVLVGQAAGLNGHDLCIARVEDLIEALPALVE